MVFGEMALLFHLKSLSFQHQKKNESNIFVNSIFVVVAQKK